MNDKPKPLPVDENAREARRILERVDRESETIGTSSLARNVERAKNHFAGNDGEDAIERWGKRIGRGLSLLAFVVLAIWLFNFLTRQ